MSEDADSQPQSISAEPSLESLLQSLAGGGGWNDLTGKSAGQILDNQRREQTLALKKQADLFRDVFLSGKGREVLEIMMDQTVRKCAWPVHLMTDAQMLMMVGIWNEAQKCFVAAIIEAMAHAKNENMQPREAP
jgi:hypothetical protein